MCVFAVPIEKRPIDASPKKDGNAERNRVGNQLPSTIGCDLPIYRYRWSVVSAGDRNVIHKPDYIDGVERCRQNIVEQLEPLIAGAQRMGEHHPYQPPLDTTQQTIDRLQRDLVEHDTILAELRNSPGWW